MRAGSPLSARSTISQEPQAPLYWIAGRRYVASFPNPGQALTEPDGLLAAGGDLSVARLVEAYGLGIFPWYEDGQPILWWTPDPRAVLFPERFQPRRSLRREMKSGRFTVTFDRGFREVIKACAAPRAGQRGTWITADMHDAYLALHRQGLAHSVETWLDGELAGGLYGVALGRVFFGESMFSRVSNASKIALASLAGWLRDWDYRLIDCQVHSAHLDQFGVIRLPRPEFSHYLAAYCPAPPAAHAWRECDVLKP
jgi:leucyl/phenylalanyl-tRNA--protein transferase